MTQQEFIELSKEEVRKLNNGDTQAREAFRAGYIYAKEQIAEYSNLDSYELYDNRMADFCGQQLEVIDIYDNENK